MLNTFRHRGFQRKVYIGVAIAIISSFLVWGVVLNEQDTQTMAPLGKIGKKSVTVRDYLNSYRAVQHQLQFMFGDRWMEMRRFVNIKGEAWDRLLLHEEARRQGIRTSDEEVVKWIAGQEAFQRQGQYYPEIYRMAVREGLRMDVRDFEEEIRQTLTIQKLTQKVLSGVTVTDEEVKDQFIKDNAVRDIEYVVLPAEPVDPSQPIEEAEIAQLYDMLKDKLTEPERVRLSFLRLPQADYETKKDALSSGAARLEERAAQQGLTVQTTGFFSRNDAVPEIGLSKEILSAAFTLPVGGESEWIPFNDQVFRVRVDEKAAERPLTLDEARGEIKRQLLSRKALDAAVQKLSGVKDAAAQNGLAAAVEPLGLKVQSFQNLKPDSYVPGIGPAQLVMRPIAELKEGQISGAFPVNNAAALVRILKDRAPDDAAFAGKKEELTEQVRTRKGQDALQDLLEKLRGGLTLNLERMKEIFPEEETA